MKRIRTLALVLAVTVQLCSIGYAANTGLLVTGGDFEGGIDGFGIAYSGRDDTVMPYIFHSDDMAASGDGALHFVASKTLFSKKSTSPQSLGFAYQGVYATEYISLEEDGEYTASADFFSEGNNVRMRFVQMVGNRAVAASPEVTLENGSWQTVSYKFKPEVTSDKGRIRIAFYNISKNNSVYIDNFTYKTGYIRKGDWSAINEGSVSYGENSAVLEADARSFENYCGMYTEIDTATLPSGEDEFVLSGTVETDMPEAFLYVSADNIPKNFAEYRIKQGEKIKIDLPFKPSECSESKIRFSIYASADGLGQSGRLILSGFDIAEKSSCIGLSQKGDTVYVSGRLRNGNGNRDFNVKINDGSEFTRSADSNGEYAFTCNPTGLEKSRSIVITISGLRGYEDCGGEIFGQITAYSTAYRENIAKAAAAETTAEGLRNVLSDGVMADIGIAQIRNYREADKDFVFGYITGKDISSFEKLESEIRTSATLNGLAEKRTAFCETISENAVKFGLKTLAAYKNEFDAADKNTLDGLFAECTTEIENLDDLKYVVTELLVKAKIGRAVNNSEAMDIIRKYADDISLDLSKYNSLDTRTGYEVANSFIAYAKGAESYTTLQSKLDEIIAASVKNDGTSGGGVTGGGGGGKGNGTSGGSGGGGIYQNYDIAPIPEADKNQSTKWEFDDLENTQWAKDGIYGLVDMGVISRSEDKKFRPDDLITRAEFAKLVALSRGIKMNEGNTVFGDVGKGDWYFEYVTALYENGIVNGITDGYFGAGEPVTRQDICTILARILGAENTAPDSTTLTDIDSVSDYARAAVIYMNGHGYVNGYEDGSFRPQSNATRAEAAKLIYSITGK